MPDSIPWPIRLATKIAERSDHPIHKVGAVIVKGGAIIACAHNIHIWRRHAEIRALKRLDVRGATIYISRNGGNLMSKPCDMCREALIKAGIARIVYFDWSGKITKERLYAC